MTAGALRFAFAMTSDAPGPARVGALKAQGASNLQYWVGQMATGGAHPSGNQTPGAIRHMVTCDLPAEATAGFAPADDLATWFGEQILPGDLATPFGAGGLLVNLMAIDDAHEEEFNDWYNTEHVARMKLVDGVLAARRFRAIDGAPRYAAFYHFTDPGVPRKPEWGQAAGTPWTARMQRYRSQNQRIAFTPISL